jgi:hypothetical protein
MRFYKIQRDELEGFPTPFIVAEIIGDRDDDGRITPYNDYAEVGEDELRAMPGGAEALARWRSRDDRLWWAKSELAHARDAALSEADDALLNALTPTERWDYFCEQFYGHADPNLLSEEAIAFLGGPRPPQHASGLNVDLGARAEPRISLPRA